MSVTQMPEIVRLAARGDGVLDDGTHVGGAVPGDRIAADGSIVHGPHHVEPPCRHFWQCGGCQLQHADDPVLRDFVHDRVLNTARGQGLDPAQVLDTHLSPARSRRRATLHFLRVKGRPQIGFKQAQSHQLVDLVECPVLVPELVELVAPLRQFLGRFAGKGAVDIAMTRCDQGVDLALSNFPLEGLVVTEAALEFAKATGLARLSIDQGYGPETMWEPEPATIKLAGVPVPMPPGAFLQATEMAERCMIDDAVEWLAEERIIADLFGGLGTFTYALAGAGPEGRKVLAVEADRAAYLACKAASHRAKGQVHALHRDLFRNPLQPAELNRFDAILLDPPRAGARAQIAEIAQSTVLRVVYVSCNPSSWARDAAMLTQAGFELTRLRPVGQFRWSTHVELVSLFERQDSAA